MEKLNISTLENAFISLEATLLKLADEKWFNQQDDIVQDTLVAGAIQKFEFVYELSIKIMKRQLKLMSGTPEEIDNTDFRDVLRSSAKAGLIDDVESWIFYRKMRNVTSHTYDQNKAQEIYQNIQPFLESARSLIKQLEKQR
ncbi:MULTISPECIES: nucleotidyltransferase substrate binding protein [Rodentibacter]|uniref:Nucleotidyltransferase n=1 Tax=Rodentibacter trehalosifermentans TaxID=1908263 RepID=A0A1V3ISV9_9PAST|nr:MULTISPECIES: nucleotidyltransferase substrate binding protein [Rodentibacter]OOF40081.1 hypothetical protein BKK49_06615 [Rodentibacter rarus]OOF45206.1 hypothetical protein BKK51_07185 [Rodentibacter trehalosifermentans]OOF48007.1 hypothetical protein BKK53_10495 [Rodentibacter trehalosifermentans]